MQRLAREIMQRVADEELGGLVAEVRETWQLMVNKFRIEDARIEPTVTMITNDNWLEFTIRLCHGLQDEKIFQGCPLHEVEQFCKF